MGAGAFMAGARDRLLPPALPGRFFAAAALFHVAAWVLVALGADALPTYAGGPGPLLAGLHLLTLGVLAMTAMGAAFQMLPVATHRPLGPRWACALTWWLFTPGVALLAWGMGNLEPLALQAGSGLVVGGLALFAGLVARPLVQVRDLPSITRHVWLALACLAGLAGLGLTLVLDWTQGFLPDRSALAATHAVLAGYGFMGMLAFGFSTVLVPMFVLGPLMEKAEHTAPLAALALVLAVAGLLGGWSWLVVAGAVAGLAAIALHLKGLAAVLKGRLRKRLEPAFRLILPAWTLLPASVVAALVSPPLWGLLMLAWLLSFVLGVLQRIMPFLASMHWGVLPSRITVQKALNLHAGLHAAAFVLLAAAMLLDSGLLARAGALAGLVGAVAFAVFAVEIPRRARAQMKGSPC